MLRNSFLLLAFFICLNSFCQTPPKSRVSFHFMKGSNILVQNSDLVGAPSYSGQGCFLYGVQYSKPIIKWVHLETGLEYVHNKIDMKPSFYPGIDMTPRRKEIDLVTIPFRIRVEFLKFFFINPGVYLDMDVKNNAVEDQTGIGFAFGVGAQYSLKSGITFIVNPILHRRSIVHFSSEKYPYNLYDTGIQFGLGYKF